MSDLNRLLLYIIMPKINTLGLTKIDREVHVMSCNKSFSIYDLDFLLQGHIGDLSYFLLLKTHGKHCANFEHPQ